MDFSIVLYHVNYMSAQDFKDTFLANDQCIYVVCQMSHLMALRCISEFVHCGLSSLSVRIQYSDGTKTFDCERDEGGYIFIGWIC